MVRLQGAENLRSEGYTIAFNPTMVRLQVKGVMKDGSSRKNFQSHYGAIASEVHLHTPTEDIDFQSHYGAIARLMTATLCKLPTTFNPTMVRLQGSPYLVSEAMMLAFQSHYGAIARGHSRAWFIDDIAFNPTMVRLQALMP